jgi:hypothetical protein
VRPGPRTEILDDLTIVFDESRLQHEGDPGPFPILRAFSSPLFMRTVGAAPWIILLILLLTISLVNTDWKQYLVTITTLVAALIAVRVVRVVHDEAATTLSRLWRTGALARRRRVSRHGKEPPDLPEARDSTKEAAAQLTEQYSAFLHTIRPSLAWAGWMGGLFLLVLQNGTLRLSLSSAWNFGWLLRPGDPPRPPNFLVTKWGGHHLLPLYVLYVLYLVVAAMVGALSGRAIAIGWKLHQLGILFDFNVHPWHPDKSGGLKPLGHLTLTIAALFLIPSMLLAGWILAPHSLTSGVDQYENLKPMLKPLLGAAVIAGLIAFFFPLYEVHKAMMRKRRAFEARIDLVSRSAWERVNELFNTETILQAPGVEEFARRVAVFDDLYKRMRKIPAWPFDAIIVAKLATYLAPALLSLLSGLTVKFVGR